LLVIRSTSMADRACVVAEGATAMDEQTLKAALKSHLVEMRDRLDQAASIAKAAEACAEAGNVDKAVEIVLDVEQLVYEVTTLLNATSLMNRIHNG
jgi:hypothetical protein